MITSFESRHAAGGVACPCGIFGGDSSSSSTTQTVNTDKRQVVDGNSVGVSSDSSTVYVNAIDAGAVQAGRDVTLANITSNSTNNATLLDTAAKLFSQTENNLQANLKLAGDLANGANSAYADAANQASGNKSLILAAIAVVGLAAAVSLSHKA